MGSQEWVNKRLILGLGNPGERYRGTRHNRGREVVQEWARRRGLEFSKQECRTRVAFDASMMLGIPETFMNRSGFAARCLMERRGLRPERVLVIYDDLSLPLGSLRLRTRGGPGGHRGMASVIENLRTAAIPRLRLGILPAEGLPPGVDLAEFVLSPFDCSEAERARGQILRAVDACEVWLRDGHEAAMNQFNTRSPAE